MEESTYGEMESVKYAVKANGREAYVVYGSVCKARPYGGLMLKKKRSFRCWIMSEMPDS